MNFPSFVIVGVINPSRVLERRPLIFKAGDSHSSRPVERIEVLEMSKLT